MKLSIRISLVMLVISTCAMILLTVLMHFKYHTTRLNLISQRLSVVSEGISYPLNNALLLGMDVKNFGEMQDIITRAKSFDSTISDIVVFKIDDNSIIPDFSTSKIPVSDQQKEEIIKSFKISKTKQWKGALGKNLRFSGVTIKDVANQERAVIVIFYDLNQSNDDEVEEIYNLYKRLAIAIIFAAFISFLTGIFNTRDLSNIMKFIENAIVDVMNSPNQKIDLGKIVEPGLRSGIRLMINKISRVYYYINKAEVIMKELKIKNKNQEDEK